jgi:hypothetical protein
MLSSTLDFQVSLPPGSYRALFACRFPAGLAMPLGCPVLGLFDNPVEIPHVEP